MVTHTEERSSDIAAVAREPTNTPYLFVVGCPRSGTTLLQRMLDHHPQLAVANDSSFIPRAIRGMGEANPPITPELVERARSHRSFARLRLPDEAIDRAAAKASKYSEFVSALYSEYGALHEKPLVGEKTPRYVRFLPLLDTLFPWARVIHLIRDGREVALSILEWAKPDKGPGRFQLWQEEPVAVCALWWRWHVTVGMRDGRRLGSARYREVRYEELIARPEEPLRDLATFLELPFAPEMLAFHEGKTRNEPGLSAKKAWLPPTAGLRDWRTQMAARDLELFEALVGDLLSELGYERTVGTVSPEIAGVAERCRTQWEAEQASKGRRSSV